MHFGLIVRTLTSSFIFNQQEIIVRTGQSAATRSRFNCGRLVSSVPCHLNSQSVILSMSIQLL
jgi:hypothetical protein